ncbi:MAG TPA: hypothetical protein VF139_09270 [Candidatus Polarisedimenticolaceae bacterium]
MFGGRVARHLIETGRLTQAQLDEAVRTQGFFGGQLETYLLKLGYVDEATLGAALTEASGVPFAAVEQLRAIPDDAMRSVPAAIVEKHRVCPFRVEDGRLRIATLNPRDLAAIREIQQASGLPVDPWITTEFRLYQALERHWKIRYPGVKAITLAPPANLPRRPSAAAGPSVEETPPQFGLDGLPLDAEAHHALDVFASPAPIAEPDPASEPVRAMPAEPARPVEPTLLADLEEALVTARDRDAVADALLGFTSLRVRRSAIFAVGKDGVKGLAGRGRAFESEKLRRVSLPPGSGTIFDTALGSRDFYFGVVPALPPNRDLYTALGGRLPASVLILPILVKERTAALLYLDDDDERMLNPDIASMRRVAMKAGLAFELLLLRNKLREI